MAMLIKVVFPIAMVDVVFLQLQQHATTFDHVLKAILGTFDNQALDAIDLAC